MDNSEEVEKLAKLLYDHLEFKEHDVKAILAAIQADPLAYVKVNTCNVCGCSIVSEDGRSCTTPAL